MSTVAQIMAELKKFGSAQTRKTYANHGAPAEMFGVKVGDMKQIAKKIKGDQELALQLYETGNVDAMYLAGIVADGSKMTKKQLDTWASSASWYMISEYSVPGVAHENEHARELAIKWIKSKNDAVAAAGWSTYAALVATRPDDEIDQQQVRELLARIESEIDAAGNRVRYTMNGFVIAVGSYVQPLLKQAQATAKKIGKVEVDMGGTACKVPLATESIAKIEKMGRVGKKRKTAKC